MSPDILDPAALLSRLSMLLPPASKRLSSPHDGIASLLHTAMSVLGFRLIGIDDSGPASSDSSNVLPEGWNKNGPGHYTFRYRHDQSSLEYILKVTKLGPRTLINAIAVESEKTESLDVSTQDFISQSFFPHDVSASDAQPLVHGFISSNRVADLMSQFKLKIVQKLVPGLRKEGYTELESNEAQSSTSRNNAASQSNPSAAQPNPQFPRFYPDEDLPFRQPPSHIPSQNPLEIGRRDLDPIPMNPFSPPPLFPPDSGDGMFVGPSHPIFNSPNSRRDAFGQPRGPWGGDGFLPPMGAPPGARFDPVGPMGPFPGSGRRLGPGNLPRGARGQDPDNDEFMPPGASDMFS